MSLDNFAIKVEKISKRYRIGLKEQMRDSFASSLFEFIKSPLRNYRTRNYREKWCRQIYTPEDTMQNHKPDQRVCKNLWQGFQSFRSRYRLSS